MGAHGGERGVSGLPEDWGKVVIPDDLSELDGLVGTVRAELRAEERYDERRARRENRLPVIVLVITIIITLASLSTIPIFGRLSDADPTPSPSISVVTSTFDEPSESCADTGSCEPSVTESVSG